MKNEQRYRLNRLAETLVTPRRFSPDFDWVKENNQKILDHIRKGGGFLPYRIIDKAHPEMQMHLPYRIID